MNRFMKKQILTAEFPDYEWKEKVQLSEHTPFSVREAYNSLRTNVIFSIPGDECKTIVVTSALPRENKSTVSANLGISLSQNGFRVLLMDCDLRLPSIANKMKISRDKKGLSDYLVGNARMEEIVVQLDNGLSVLTAGTIPPNPSELIGTDRMKKLLSALKKSFDYIILDTPPLGMVADAGILSGISSGVILVCYQGKASRDSINSALNQLQFSGARVLGFVYTGVDSSHAEKYTGYKGYYSYARRNTGNAESRRN